jgi:hypothetical protein
MNTAFVALDSGGTRTHIRVIMGDTEKPIETESYFTISGTTPDPNTKTS